MKKLLPFLILFMQYGIYAQSGTIKGKVTDATQKPVEFSTILLLSSTDSSLVKGTIAEIDGAYLFENVSPGSYLIKASLVGFQDVHSSVFASANDQVSDIDLTMSEGVQLSEVTIKAKKPFIEMKADKIVVNIEDSGINSGNSALEVLEKSPGVTVDKDNNISLRGKQGVLVTINGKNQYMSGDEISQLLETMPAENINSIEIIANPSAKYDAQGNSGIINIRLKKNENIGLNGSVNAGVRQGVNFTNNQGINFNYRSEKVNLYGSGSRYDWSSFQDLEIARIIPFQNGLTTFDLTSHMNQSGISANYKLGVDVSLGEMTTVGALAKYNGGTRDNTISSLTMIDGDNAPSYNVLNVESVDGSDRDQWSYNLNLRHLFDKKGTELSVDLDYSTYDRLALSNYDNFYHDRNGENTEDPYYLRNDQNTIIDIMAGKADFSKTLAGGYSLEAGAKISMVETTNDTRFEDLRNEVWTLQPNRTNSFIYQEDVMAAYVNLAKAFGKLNVQAGLRMEHTESEGNSITLDNIIKRSYTDFFPSVSISHMLGQQHSLSYTYSRRLERPNYQSLNPFINYLDQYTFEKGNPFLNPQYTNSFGINYGLGRALFVSANYSETTDEMSEVIEQVSSENATFQTYQNLDNSRSASLTISSPKVWSEQWTTRSSLTAFYNEFTSAIPSGVLDNHSTAVNLYVSNQISLPKEIGLEISGNYTSPLKYGLFEIDTQVGLDIAFTKSVMNGDGNIKIGLDDVFRSRNNTVVIKQDDIDTVVDQMRDTRRVKVNFTYRFGNKKVKSARKRRTATEDETSRINNEG